MTAISYRQLGKAVGVALEKWLAPEGFVPDGQDTPDGAGVQRWQGNRFDCVHVLTQRIGGINRVTPFGWMGFREIDEIYDRFMSENPSEPMRSAEQISLRYANFKKDWNAYIPCQEREDLDRCLLELREFILTEFYPKLMSFDSPQKVLWAYLKKDESDRRNFDPPGFRWADSALRGLILARLYGPEHYASLKARYTEFLKRGNANLQTRTDRLVAYLEIPGELPPLPPVT